jgi:hypothetical protein
MAMHVVQQENITCMYIVSDQLLNLSRSSADQLDVQDTFLSCSSAIIPTVSHESRVHGGRCASSDPDLRSAAVKSLLRSPGRLFTRNSFDLLADGQNVRFETKLSRSRAPRWEPEYRGYGIA